MKPAITPIVLVGVLAAASPVRADRAADSVAASEAAIGQQVPDLRFTDTNGRPLSLASLRGKPVLLTLIYTGCADVCPSVIESLAPALEIGEEALGNGSFSSVTVGFDTRNDTPQRMRSFARDHGAGGENWHFVSADMKTLDQLTAAVGFSYFASAGGFDHMAQVTILDKDGRVYRQVFGSTFDPPQIVEPLKELVFSREKPFLSFAGLADRVKLFCTVYNPNTGRYYFNYSLFVSIVIGIVSLGLVLFFLARETLKAMRAGGT